MATTRTRYLNALADQALQVPDEMLLQMIDDCSDDVTAAAILMGELEGRTAPKFNGLASILAAHGL